MDIFLNGYFLCLVSLFLLNSVHILFILQNIILQCKNIYEAGKTLGQTIVGGFNVLAAGSLHKGITSMHKIGCDAMILQFIIPVHTYTQTEV